jgi:hypothetical protein
MCGCPDEGGQCKHDVDCPGLQVCRSKVCVYLPCGGGCDQGEYCEGARCMPCTNDQDCGQDCVDCSAQDSDRFCLDGACGCVSQADCLAQQLCFGNVCTWCVPDCSRRCCGNDGCSGACPDRCGEINQVCNPVSCVCEQACEPADCLGLGKQCGSWDDTCGVSIECGPCAGDQTCSAEGQCLGPIGPHEGAGQACRCEGADCSIPCPQEPDAASICLVTNQPQVNDGFCSFACDGPGHDAQCQIDFADGCCLVFGPLYYCVDLAHCSSERQYLQTCGQDIGACDTDLVCVSFDENPFGYCVWGCDYPDGSCADSGECVGLQDGGGACLPPGNLSEDAMCAEPLAMCAPDLVCLRPRTDRVGFCSPSCTCQTGLGCADPDDCIWTITDVTQRCYCGHPCPSQDPALDCPNSLEWECVDEGDAGAPFFICEPSPSAS